MALKNISKFSKGLLLPNLFYRLSAWYICEIKPSRVSKRSSCHLRLLIRLMMKASSALLCMCWMNQRVWMLALPPSSFTSSPVISTARNQPPASASHLCDFTAGVRQEQAAVEAAASPRRYICPRQMWVTVALLCRRPKEVGGWVWVDSWQFGVHGFFFLFCSLL